MGNDNFLKNDKFFGWRNKIMSTITTITISHIMTIFFPVLFNKADWFRMDIG